MTTSRRASWTAASCAAPLLGLLVASCDMLGPNSPLTGLACPELQGGALSGSFTADAKTNGTIRAFVVASSDLGVTAASMEAQVADACTRMGMDLGLGPQQLQPAGGPGGRAQGACGPVAARIDGILRAAGNAQLAITYAPPECRFAADAYASCAASCNIQLDPGSIVAHCSPGRLSGTCQGTCNGGCDGTCSGSCQGACSAAGPGGQCNGECSGTCHGQCSATCHAQCQGQWIVPRCDVDARGPNADAKCDASCKAHAEVTAACTPARVWVQGTSQWPDVARLAATLQMNLPVLLTAQLGYGKRLVGDMQAMGDVAADLGTVLGNVGAHATACIAAAGAEVAQATASIRVSVSVSASISGRVGAAG